MYKQLFSQAEMTNQFHTILTLGLQFPSKEYQGWIILKTGQRTLNALLTITAGSICMFAKYVVDNLSSGLVGRSAWRYNKVCF